MEIAFIGFGEAAKAFHQTLSQQAPSISFSAYDILLESEGVDGSCGSAMRAKGVWIAKNLTELASAADWVISAVTADQSAAAAEAAAPFLRKGQVFIEINSVAPARKRANSIMIEQRGASYLDMAVMAPVHPRGHRTPAIIAGACAEAVAPVLMELDFKFESAGAEAGAATAIKMVRSLFVKGLEALTVEALLAAEASGCFETILDSLAKSYPGLGWPAFGEYQFERTTRHGLRRAAEMEECAATLDDLGRAGALASAIADVQRNMASTSAEQAGSIAAVRAKLQGLAPQEARKSASAHETG